MSFVCTNVWQPIGNLVVVWFVIVSNFFNVLDQTQHRNTRVSVKFLSSPAGLPPLRRVATIRAQVLLCSFCVCCFVYCVICCCTDDKLLRNSSQGQIHVPRVYHLMEFRNKQSLVDYSDCCCCFVKTLPLRTDFPDDDSPFHFKCA